MIVCPRCYEQVTEDFRANDELCPYCFHTLPEPEPEPEQIVEAVVEAPPPVRTYGVADMSGAHSDPTIYEPEKKSKGMVIGIAVAVILAVAVGGYFMFGRSDEGGAGGPKKAKGLDPKLVASLNRLDKQIGDRLDFFFKKTCESFQKTGYTYKIKLGYDNSEIWKSSIQPGDGGATTNENWFLCPIRLAEIRSKSDMTLVVKSRFQPPPDLFSKASRYVKVSFEGKNVVPIEEVPEKDLYTGTWEKVKDKFVISVGALYKAPKYLKDINGRHDYKYKSKLVQVSIGKNTLSQQERKGPGNIYGKFTALVPGWFGETFTKYIKDWGTGCANDVNEQFKKIRQSMIDKHDDLELFADSKQLTGYMELAEKGGKKLCTAMPKAYKIINLYDEGKASEAEALTKEFELDLKAAKKILREELPAYIKNLK
ncbi:MAG: hypothetical protein JXR95_16375 [Deltaproteobacteria bacterium]|nr:hypothetical protein [Deltaproteobacteria bacterium]